MYVLSLNFLRLLIIISLILYFFYFFAPYFYENYYDAEVLHLLFMSPVKPVLSVPESISWLLLFTHLVASFMLFIQYNFARYIYLAVILIDIFINSMSGVIAYTGIDMFLISWLNMTDALIIFLSFFRKSLLGSNITLA